MNPAARTALAYIVIAAGYIVLSGWLVDHLITDGDLLIKAEIGKGVGFVVVTGFVLYRGLNRHITRQAQLEAEKRTYSRILHNFFNHAPTPAFLRDKNGKFVLVNRPFVNLTGKAEEQVLGKTPESVLGKDLARHYEPYEERVVHTGKPLSFRVEIDWPGNGKREMDITKFPIFGEDGNLTHVGTIFLDVTELRQLEKRFERTKRLEAIGQLTAGIAHDFNNLLTVIYGHADMIDPDSPDDAEELAQHRRMIRHAVQKATEMTDQLLAFARQQPLESRPFDTRAVIDHLLPMLERTLSEDIEINIRMEEDLWPVMADPAGLENALLNLAANARDAMPDGGELSIEADNVRVEASLFGMPVSPEEGDYVRISVADRGCGMSDEALAYAFDPFFTTKGPGRGTGLGLSMVYGFARQSGGTANIYSEQGHGTTITIYLPRTRREPEPISDLGYANARGLPEMARVLVVEDDAMVRDVAVRLLKELGYDVFEAQNGRQALEIVKRDKKIDLLFSDIVMPGGMNGHELAQRVKEIVPSIKIVLATGFAGQPRESAARDDLVFEKLRKPYDRRQLLAVLRRAFNEDRGDENEI